jgi:uncharacterized Zn finger protein (UPF0148 family)
MKCQRCGSTYFEEENGLYYCGFCQTQSQVLFNINLKLI